jgi:hypothetical protein
MDGQSRKLALLMCVRVAVLAVGGEIWMSRHHRHRHGTEKRNPKELSNKKKKGIEALKNAMAVYPLASRCVKR